MNVDRNPMFLGTADEIKNETLSTDLRKLDRIAIDMKIVTEINEFISKPCETFICDLSIRNSPFHVIIQEIGQFANILETLLMPILDPVLEKLYLRSEEEVRMVWFN